MSYRPRLSDGRVAPMPWQILLFSINVCWPLETDTSLLRRNLDKFLVITTFTLMSLCITAAVNYVISNAQNIDLVLDNVAPNVLQFDYQLRFFIIAFHKTDFRNLLEEFYAKIYIEKESNRKLYRSIKRNLLPTEMVTCMVIFTLCFVTVVIIVFANKRLLLMKMLLPFDYTQFALYVPTLAVSYLVGFQQVSLVIGESYMLALCILHLDARYQLLQQDCQNIHKILLDSRANKATLYQFHQSLLRIVLRNVELNNFADKLRAEYSWRIFITMVTSSIGMCVLCFMPLMYGISSRSAHYILWFLTKGLALFALGQLGSKLISTTSEMGSMYYESHWEDVIQLSSNGVENAKLMKLITLAIEMNQKPIYMTGLSFFNLSLPSFLALIRSGYAYFSCLYALRYS